MASTDRNKTHIVNTEVKTEVNTATDATNVLRDLETTPWEFDFYYALRKLECLYADNPRVGTSVRAKEDVLRLGQEPSTVFAPATLATFKQDKNQRLRLKVFFQGLFGANGPLPLHLSEYARTRVRNEHDPAMAEFMDLFHHRLLSFFYRAWANKEPTVQYDRPDEDNFHRYIGSLLGVGTDTFKQQDAMPDHSKLYFAGHFANKTHHASGLLAILRHFFQIPITMEEFIGEWLEMPTSSRCALGQGSEGGFLGQDTALGAASWQRQFKFRLYLGPLGLTDYKNFMPGEDALYRLSTIIRNYLGYELTWEINLILKKEEIPNTTLGQQGQLGRTCWLNNTAIPQDADDLYLQASQAYRNLSTEGAR